MTDIWLWRLLLASTALPCLIVAYRLLLHPLRSHPGPKLAAVTEFYRFYYDIVLGGAYLEHLETLHAVYGPVVRVGPNELHFSDPAAFASIYRTGSTFTKDYRLYRAFMVDSCSFTLIDPRQSRIRRDLLGPFFSRRAILKLEDVIQQKVDHLLARLRSFNKPVNLHLAFRCVAMDIITSYCFARSHNTLDSPDFENYVVISIQNSFAMSSVFRYFPWVIVALQTIPPRLLLRMKPELKGIAELRRKMEQQIDQILANPASLENAEHEVIYHHWLKPDPAKKRHQLPSRTDLLHEAINFQFAGTDTAGNISTVGTFHVLSNRAVRDALVQELNKAWPDKDAPLDLEALEKLPYLTAVIKESLRVGVGAVTPLPRVVGPGDAHISGVRVPPGTVVASGTKFLHFNSDIFPDPHKFVPERWLQPDSRDLEKYLVPFSRGPRMCIGLNLAWCELYLILGNLFRKMDLTLHDTTIDDLRYREYFGPVYLGKKVYAVVKERAV